MTYFNQPTFNFFFFVLEVECYVKRNALSDLVMIIKMSPCQQRIVVLSDKFILYQSPEDQTKESTVYEWPDFPVGTLLKLRFISHMRVMFFFKRVRRIKYKKYRIKLDCKMINSLWNELKHLEISL